jgi:NAD(P)-dependent dehydrogenase (short-subunit alcohol dehydrogenase family)
MAAVDRASDFEGRIVVVTGAAGNLGAAVADAFAERGASLVLVDLRTEALAARFGDEGGSHLLVAADLRTQAGADEVAAAALARLGRIDVLCNIAGAFRMGEAVHETSDETWRFLFDVNVHSVLHMARAVVPPMLAAGGGSIVNVGANSAQRGGAHVGAYAASKSAVVRLTEAMSAELRERNVNVNCVLPGVIDTPQNRAAMPDADPARWVSAADLARVIVFLASSAARAIHGAAIPVVGLG